MDEAESPRLIALIREASRPLAPRPPVLPPEWEALRSSPVQTAGTIRAVLFDVYGTLFCSAAGDSGSDAANSGGVVDGGGALDTLARQYDPRLCGAELRSFFRQSVSTLRRSRSTESAWPEVCVEQIWSAFLRERGLQAAVSGAAGRELALRYELAINPVWPMPGAVETITALGDSGLRLGLISNAQFFTPLFFEAFFGATPALLGFDPDLIIWSFVFGEAKPSPCLFDAAARRLLARGVSPAECVFVGNDMLSDIYGAITAGFQGILFAGDNRSLRLREGEPLVQGLWPARVIRHLAELTGR